MFRVPGVIDFPHWSAIIISRPISVFRVIEDLVQIGVVEEKPQDRNCLATHPCPLPLAREGGVQVREGLKLRRRSA
ncbi:MAG: hypothetical protein AUK39_06460 [Dehalococcoidia bacterium CG2_30_46_19]|nr:MAG: hypothetical protein AUK39_06460 [Dehalococcoidia bacterium CG2_30_46_19]